MSFAGTAAVVQPPTRTREDIIAAIDRFQLQRGTAVGSGILVSLKTIFPDAEFDLRSWNPRADQSKATPLDSRRDAPDKAAVKPVPPGSLHVGRRSSCSPMARRRPAPIRSRRRAWPAERGVRVFTVGIGTDEGEMIGAEGWSMRVRLDEASLKRIAIHARRVFLRRVWRPNSEDPLRTLNSRMVLERKETEIHRAVSLLRLTTVLARCCRRSCRFTVQSHQRGRACSRGRWAARAIANHEVVMSPPGRPGANCRSA